MMGRPPEYSPLLRFAGTVLKYYFLAWFCLGIVCLMLAGLGAVEFAVALLLFIGAFLLRSAIFIVCLLVVAAIAEAWRYW